MASFSWARNRPLAPPSMMRWSKVAETVMVGTSTALPSRSLTTGRAMPKAAIMLVPDGSMGVPARIPSAPTLLTVAVAPVSSWGAAVRSRAAAARRSISVIWLFAYEVGVEAVEVRG